MNNLPLYEGHIIKHEGTLYGCWNLLAMKATATIGGIQWKVEHVVPTVSVTSKNLLYTARLHSL